MKFVLVNHRTPLDRTTCAACSRPLGSGYLKAVSTQRSYCDYDCYVRGEARSLATAWLSAIPFEMMTSFATASCCYSIMMARIALRLGELMTTEMSAGDRRRRT
jgi:hypothetical protein